MLYENVEYDFIERTIEIIKQYNGNCYTAPPQYEKYSVTLLLNCLVGLLIFPFENKRRAVDKLFEIKFFDGDNTNINTLDESWGLTGFEIETIHDFKHNKIEDIKTTPLRVLIYRLRNSIAHSRWQQVENDKNISIFYDGYIKGNKQGIGVIYQTDEKEPNKSKINALIFTDLNPDNNDLRFKAKISVKSLEIFIIKFASEILKTKYNE